MDIGVTFRVNNYVIVAAIVVVVVVVVSMAHVIILSYLYLTVFDLLLPHLLEFWCFFVVSILYVSMYVKSCHSHIAGGIWTEEKEKRSKSLLTPPLI
jgi:hypothetical protein